MFRLSLVVVFISFGCQSKPEPPVDKNVVITVQKHAESKEGDFEQKSLMCCDTDKATSLLNKYLDLTRAMAKDDDFGTSSALRSLVSHIRNNSYEQEDKLANFLKAVSNWNAHAISLIGPDSMTRRHIQKNFEDASLSMINYAKSHKSNEGLRIIVAFCPMAPGRWLQTEKTISNPYYGSEMLTCGVFEE
jgi:hypothetical protein